MKLADFDPEIFKELGRQGYDFFVKRNVSTDKSEVHMYAIFFPFTNEADAFKFKLLNQKSSDEEIFEYEDMKDLVYGSFGIHGFVYTNGVPKLLQISQLPAKQIYFN